MLKNYWLFFSWKNAKNTNEGENSILMLQKAGQKRTLVAFNLSPYESDDVTEAKLRLYVTYNAGNWGKHNDRAIEAFKLAAGWTEGNGANFVPKDIDEDDEPVTNKGSENPNGPCAPSQNGLSLEPPHLHKATLTILETGSPFEF